MKKTVLTGLALSVAIMGVTAGGAEARMRWYPQHLPWWFDDSPPATYDRYDRELDYDAARRLPPRERELWWMDSNDLEPAYDAPRKVVKKKPVKKAAAVTAKTSKPKKPSLAKADPAKLPVKPSTAGKGVQTASLSKPATTGSKTIGCTAGAAIVTGYGFGQVSPKTCTGATYSYGALRDGKSYLIKLSAASGEILDVKKVQ